MNILLIGENNAKGWLPIFKVHEETKMISNIIIARCLVIVHLNLESKIISNIVLKNLSKFKKNNPSKIYYQYLLNN